jgi:hypothetical protein
MRWFGNRTVAAGGADGLQAYRDGRADERDRVDHDLAAARAAPAPLDRGELDDAYARGRREERLRHRGSPFLALITIVLVLIALAVLYLAVTTGSFAGAGTVIDNTMRGPVHGAADQAGNALVNAGQNLKARAADGGSPPTNSN